MDRNRFRGCLLGLACGDALGTTLEFKPPGTFVPVEEMVGGGPFGLKPGQWTDDTSMALCLAESLLECRGFDAKDQLKRYVRWWKEGYLSSTGDCFDIGNTVKHALMAFERTNEQFAGGTDEYSAGNGCIMRLAPLPMFFVDNEAQAIETAGSSSRTTHNTRICIDACRYFSGLIVGALQGVPKDMLLSEMFCPVEFYWNQRPLVAPQIIAVASGSFKSKGPPEIRGSGYVVDCLEAALWAFHNSDSFREGCLLAVNLGEDADTTGAVFGQLAGAYYGEKEIPEKWRNQLAMRQKIEDFADKLHELAVPTRS